MSKGPWKNKKKKIVDAQASPVDAPVKPESPPVNDSLNLPPPLPPFSSGGESSAGPLPAPNVVGQTDVEFASSLGKVFISSVKSIENIGNLALKSFETKIEFEAVDPLEGELWGQMALPVVKKYMPKFQDHPEWALAFTTVAILGGKLKIRKKVVYDDGRKETINSETVGGVS